ncbi:MAG: hypothetical protein ACOH2V_00490 [Candidatus Saccharimonadaceae bacterium]
MDKEEEEVYIATLDGYFGIGKTLKEAFLLLQGDANFFDVSFYKAKKVTVELQVVK